MSSSNSNSIQVHAEIKPEAETPKPRGMLAMLRGRSRPLHEAAIEGIEQETGPDVWFVCSQGRVVGAHKIILAISSEFFATVFQDQNTTDETVIHVPDVPVETMQLILSLLYRDSVNVPLDVMTSINEYMGLFGMGLDKFIMGEAQKNAQPVINRVYDHIPSRDKTTTDDKLKEDFSRKKGVVPVGTIPNGSNNTRSTPGTSNNKRQSIGYSINRQAMIPVATPPTLALAPPLLLVLANYGGKYCTMGPSQDPNTSAQLHLLDQQPNTNPVSVPVQAESAVLGNNLAAGQDQKRPRLVLLKSTSTGSDNRISPGQLMKMPNSRPITASELIKKKAEQAAQRESAGGPPVLERMTNTDEENAIEVDADEVHVADSNDVQETYTDWLANLSKSSSSTTPTPSKRMKVTPLKRTGSEMTSIKTPEKAGRSKCRICGVTFDTMNKLKWHTDRHLATGVYKCPKCTAVFKSARAVHEHEKSHSQTRKKLVTGRQLPPAESRTPVVKHPDPERPGKYIRLCECGKWTQYHNYLYHVKTGHKSQVFFCDRCCDKVFPTKQDLQQHQCDECNGNGPMADQH